MGLDWGDDSTVIPPPGTELAITIQVPFGTSEVLVRLPVVPRNEVAVDFRGAGSPKVWTPSTFWPGSVDVREQ